MYSDGDFRFKIQDSRLTNMSTKVHIPKKNLKKIQSTYSNLHI